MHASVVADAGFLVALLDRRDNHHRWAIGVAARQPPPWQTCEAVLTETFYLLDPNTAPLVSLIRRGQLFVSFDFGRNANPILALMEKYADLPMSLADACLVRMTEILPDPVVLTTDEDFRIYRRNSRQVVPCRTPV